MTKVYLSFKKKLLLGISSFIGLLLPFLGGGGAQNVSADTPAVNQYNPDGPSPSPDPCPDPGCCN